jgi:hypothetical protein
MKAPPPWRSWAIASAGSTKAARIGSSSPGMRLDRALQGGQALAAHVVHASAEHLVDQVFLAAEVVIDRRDVDIGAAGDLAQRRRCKALLREQFLRCVQDPVLGREMRQGHRSPRRIKRLFDATAGRHGRQSPGIGKMRTATVKSARIRRSHIGQTRASTRVFLLSSGLRPVGLRPASLENPMALERTLSIIKPDAVAKNVIGEIYSRFEKAGLKVVAAKMKHLSQAGSGRLLRRAPRAPVLQRAGQLHDLRPGDDPGARGRGRRAEAPRPDGRHQSEGCRAGHHPRRLRRPSTPTRCTVRIRWRTRRSRSPISSRRPTSTRADPAMSDTRTPPSTSPCWVMPRACAPRRWRLGRRRVEDQLSSISTAPRWSASSRKSWRKKFRAQQVMKWIHHRYVTDFGDMTDLGKVLRAKLKRAPSCMRRRWCSTRRPKTAPTSGCSAWMRRTRSRPCTSRTRGAARCACPQVGCALNCQFCSTATQGFNRNLSTAEIIGQVWVAARHLGNVPHQQRKLTNVVMMGMGEPLPISTTWCAR